jgi:hypothetical protein
MWHLSKWGSPACYVFVKTESLIWTIISTQSTPRTRGYDAQPYYNKKVKELRISLNTFHDGTIILFLFPKII